MSVVSESHRSSAPAKPAFRQYAFSDEFIAHVNKYMEYDEKINKVNEALNAIKEKQKEEREAILTYMKLNSIPSCPLADGKAIYYVVKKQPKKVDTKMVFERLKLCMGDKYESVVKFINDPAAIPIVEKEKILVK